MPNLVLGTASDGTLYVGEDALFSTLPARKQPQVNLASLEAGARVMAVSSNFGGAATTARGAQTAPSTARSLRLDVVERDGGNTGLVGLAAQGAPVNE